MLQRLRYNVAELALRVSVEAKAAVKATAQHEVIVGSNY
jgi:hypothetical protein